MPSDGVVVGQSAAAQTLYRSHVVLHSINVADTEAHLEEFEASEKAEFLEIEHVFDSSQFLESPVFLQSLEGTRFSLSGAAARQSTFIDHILASAQDFGDRDSGSAKVIECPIHSAILFKVAHYLSLLSEQASLNMPDDAAGIDVAEDDTEVLVGLLRALDFLDAQRLLRAVSSQIKRILMGESSEDRKAVLAGRVMGAMVNTSIVDIWGPTSSDPVLSP
jgi:hypothetical protein